MNPPLFSVLVANYNRAPYLRECIDSLLAQTYPHFEIIIVDDGSTDESFTIIESYQKKDSRIRVHRQPANLGCGATMRKCVDLASGQWLCLVGSDDVLLPNALQIMADAHMLHPECSVICSTHYVCDEKLNEVRLAYGACEIPKGESYLTYGKGITSLASFTRKHYDMTAGIDASFKRAVDQDFYYKLEEVGSIFFVNKPTYKYRVNLSGISTHKNLSKSRYWFALAKENAYQRRLGKNGVRNASRKEIDAWWSLVFATKAAEAGKRGQWSDAYCWMKKSLSKSIFDRYMLVKAKALFMDSSIHKTYKRWKGR